MNSPRSLLLSLLLELLALTLLAYMPFVAEPRFGLPFPIGNVLLELLV
jgi:hypothetical protein